MSKGRDCRCSNNRKCKTHKALAKRQARLPEPVHEEQRVQVGIEELRRRYGRDARR